MCDLKTPNNQFLPLPVRKVPFYEIYTVHRNLSILRKFIPASFRSDEIRFLQEPASATIGLGKRTLCRKMKAGKTADAFQNEKKNYLVDSEPFHQSYGTFCCSSVQFELEIQRQVRSDTRFCR